MFGNVCRKPTILQDSRHNVRERVEADLTPGKEQVIGWRGKVVSAREPWVAVIAPDGNLAERREITGSVEGGAEK